MSPTAYLITYANGHTVLQAGEDVEEQTSFSVSRGFATRRDLDGGAFELTSTEDGRTRRYEPVTDEPPGALSFRELASDDGLDWQNLGIVPSSQAARRCARQVDRGFARLYYLADGTMVLLERSKTAPRQLLRYQPVGS